MTVCSLANNPGALTSRGLAFFSKRSDVVDGGACIVLQISKTRKCDEKW